LLSQPKVLKRFHAMVGGDAALAGEAAVADGGPGREPGRDRARRPEGPDPGGGEPGGGDPEDRGPEDRGPEDPDGAGPGGLREILSAYLRAEQRLGRVDRSADIDAAVPLVVGAIHGQVLPRVLFSPPGSPLATPPGLAGRLAQAVLSGIEPGSTRR